MLICKKMSTFTKVGMINITWLEYEFVLMIYQGIWGFKVNLGKLTIKDVRLEGGVDDSSYGKVEVQGCS